MHTDGRIIREGHWNNSCNKIQIFKNLIRSIKDIKKTKVKF